MYLTWNEQTVSDFSDANVNSLYNQGYLFTRVGKGVMKQTRSVRIDLSQFELSSENRRILKKTEGLEVSVITLPYAAYDWHIGKMAHDFYESKFGKGTFSANKIKELFTNPEKSNFNRVLVYRSPLLGKEGPSAQGGGGVVDTVGYCIAFETDELIHYSYPFYGLRTTDYGLQNVGLGMMLRAILYAKEQSKKYIYLGSAQRPGDTYKLQFAGLEWFDGEEWSKNIIKLKTLLDS